ncbi:hypothetical protein BT93_I0377 [Corymbia citriodora subsp. variegata]|nr:hypothetical protein BT93_I0377 [Corymbia citriodora subsp. variegata]
MDRGSLRLQLLSGRGVGRSRSRSRAPGSRNPSRDQLGKGKFSSSQIAASPRSLEGRTDPSFTDMENAGLPQNQKPIATDQDPVVRLQRVGNQPQATRSWANVAKAAMQGYSLTFFPTRPNEDNIVHCFDEDLEAADPIWHQCLVGYFVGKKLSFRLVETALKHLWGHRLLEVKANDQGFYFFHISDAEFRREILEGGPLTVARVPLILQQWKPMLDLKNGEHSSIPVWIRLKNLPYGLWSATGLSKVASAIGKPLYVDQRTEQLKMISFARVCVELSATKPCHDSITVFLNGETRMVDVEYEWKPLSCLSCGVFGHRCHANGPTSVVSQPISKALPIRTTEQVCSPAGMASQTSSHSAAITGLSPELVADQGLDVSRGFELNCPSELASDDGWQQVNRRQHKLPSWEAAQQRSQQPNSANDPASQSRITGQTPAANPHLAESSMQQPAGPDEDRLCRKQQLQSVQQLLRSKQLDQGQENSNIQQQQIVLAEADQNLEAVEPASPTSFASVDDLDEEPAVQLNQAMQRNQTDPLQEDVSLNLQLTEVRVEQINSPGLPAATPPSRPYPLSYLVGLGLPLGPVLPRPSKGLMNPAKQAEVRQFVRLNKICCVGILETKVSVANFNNLSSGLIPGWKWMSNYEYSSRGRIWVGWNPSLVGFNAILCTDQLIHGELKFLYSGIILSLSVAYGEHTYVARRSLWNHLINLSLALKEEPWMVAGDFNAIRDSSDRMGSPNIWIPAFDEFKECLDQAELIDLRYVGFRYTWFTSSGANRKQRKIDRVLVNNHWCSAFLFSEASFLPSGISDHTPMVVRILAPVSRRTPFKFFNFWLTHPEFPTIVAQVWEVHVTGTPMFKLYARLKILKARLKSLNRDNFSDISLRVNAAKLALTAT